MMRRNDLVTNQVVFANIVFAAGIILAFLSFPAFTFERAVFLAAFLITGFYFWWGYLFLALNGMESGSILEYLYDFSLVVLLLGLLWIGASDLAARAALWLGLYLVLFLLVILRYVLARSRASGQRQRRFFTEKIRIDSIAAACIALFFLLAFLFHLELLAVFCVFLMELVHILYVGFVTRFYEKF